VQTAYTSNKTSITHQYVNESPIIDLVTGEQDIINLVFQFNIMEIVALLDNISEPIESKVKDYQWDQTLENNPF
jgi:ABC-type iron transport system FetAB ATPase subunit